MGGPEMAPLLRQAKGATPPSYSPGQRSERPGDSWHSSIAYHPEW